MSSASQPTCLLEAKIRRVGLFLVVGVQTKELKIGINYDLRDLALRPFSAIALTPFSRKVSCASPNLGRMVGQLFAFVETAIERRR